MAAGNLSDPGALRELLNRHGFRFSKAMGQNFLINPSVCPRMAAACGAGGCAGVLEVGPGVGVLTRELAQVAQKVVAVELDARLLPVLEETLQGYKNVEIVRGDVLKMDLHALLEEKFGGGPVCVCANLPYYITSPVVMGLLESGLPLHSLTVLVQKEAAQRLCAPPGTRACGAVSVSVHYHSQPELLFQVGRGSFMPAPHVDSAVLRMAVRPSPPVQVPDEAFFFQVARAAFSQRRKMAANALSSGLGMEKARIQKALLSAGARADCRAEQLTLEQFAALSRALWDGQHKPVRRDID